MLDSADRLTEIIDAHLGLEGCLGEADDPVLPTPCVGGFGVVQQHESPGTEL